MPNKKLKQQQGNSCAAHCTVVAIADLLDDTSLLNDVYAESDLWPSIQFKGDGNELVTHLAERKNSDPRKIVNETDLRWAAVKATLLCDETQKATAFEEVPEDQAPQLGALFNMMKEDGSVTTIEPVEGNYYNASYLMFEDGLFTGLHNILVTNVQDKLYYYNPNEEDPDWQFTQNWKTLDNLNQGRCKYVFTGVCVEFKKR
jgi:hypothetical protein